MQHYDLIERTERDGFTIIVDKTYEDINPRDQFEADDMDEILRKIDNGTYEWFMLRVRVLVEGLELGSHYLGGCLYEDPREVLTDGTAEDCISEALKEAKSQVYRMSKKFAELSDQVDRESASA
jgi:hypothetical protein